MKKLLLLLATISFTLIFCSGCSKNEALDFYKDATEIVGDNILTSETNLKGTREFASDHYTGTYNADYKDFTGEEVLFGGTTIERDKENIHVKINIEDSQGNIKVIMKLKENKKLIATEDGFYEFDFNVKDGSNYLIIKAEKYSGKVNIEIE